MIAALKRRWPAVVGVAVYVSAVLYLTRASIRLNGGHFVYALDDAYIHMAMAKNAVLHGVWGVTPYGFTSATSSPLWTAILAGIDGIVGIHDITPLLLNVLAGSALLLTIAAALDRRSASPVFVVAALTIVTWVGPLPTLALTGMEHTAHALTTLLLILSAAAALAAPAAAPTPTVMLAALAGLNAALRYEGAIVAALVALLFAVTRRWRNASAVAAGAALPIVAYGLWSIAHGWLLFPNSILLKGRIPEISGTGLLRFLVGWPALHQLVFQTHVLLLLVAALLAIVALALAVREWDEDKFLLTIVAGALLGHMQVAGTGWFYRYEAYLVIATFAVFSLVGAGWLPRLALSLDGAARAPLYAVFAVLCVVAGFPFASRALNAFRNTPLASANIFQQQYQMGLFLDRFYRGRSVAANDIGAVTYLSDVRLFDVYGLASLEAARLRRAGQYRAPAIGALANEHQTAIAIVYQSWFGEYGGVPEGWTHVGDWGVTDNVVLGGSAVSFYAVDPRERAPLLRSLRQFAPTMPADVIQSGEYRAAAEP